MKEEDITASNLITLDERIKQKFPDGLPYQYKIDELEEALN